MQALIYNPMIMQASYTMYSLVDYCKGDNESDLRPIIFPISTPLVPEDCNADVLIGTLGSLPGGIATLVDVMQLLATYEKALSNPPTDSDKSQTSSAEDDGMSSSDQSSILGPPPLMSCKPSMREPSSCFQFAFNHILASNIQAQLLQRITMPPPDEPVPEEARLPLSSLGSVVSLFDLPLIRPLIAKSMQKSATELSAGSSQTVTKLIPTPPGPVAAPRAPGAATGDGILGRPPVPRFQGPQRNAAIPMAPRGIGSNTGHSQGPAIRPFAGRNFAGAGNRPRLRGDSRPAMRDQAGETNQWTGSWQDNGNNNARAGWQWNSEGQNWDSGPAAIEPNWNSYSRQPVVRPAMSGIRNSTKVPPKPPAPARQSAFPAVRGKLSQVRQVFDYCTQLITDLLTTCEAAWFIILVDSVCQMITFKSLNIGTSYLNIRYISRQYGSRSYMKVKVKVITSVLE